MRKLLGQAAIALGLFAAGYVIWRVGELQNRVADAHEELALLRYNSANATYADIEGSVEQVARVPWIGDALLNDARSDRAAGDYWLARYDTLAARHDPSPGTPDERTPSELALSANAGFRASQREGADRQATLSRLDAALKSYTELLKKNPGDADAAYNYEYVVRLRDTVSKAKPQAPGKREDPAKVIQKLTGVVLAGDLPDGRTVHGDPGSPPPNTDMTQFKMHIPVRPDERQGGSDAGQGKEKVRKG
jgi:tetratricopeptide (TPR) repeat protein